MSHAQDSRVPIDGLREAFRGQRIPRYRLGLLLGGGVGLLLGMYTGLARAGLEHSIVRADIHGIVMVFGFLGTVIAVERAVALGARWGYIGPATSGVAVFVLPFAHTTGGVLLFVAGVVVCLTYTRLMARGSRDMHLVIMGIGAALWVYAMVLWLAGFGPIRITPLLVGFLVLTVIGERLELSRLTMPSASSRHRFLGATGAFVAGTVVAPFWRSSGLIVAGIAVTAQVLWMGRYDLARRTVKRHGVTRYAAACMLSGYVWLFIGGGFMIAVGIGLPGALLHDALVHAIFLGFILSMVMGHAPIIIPAVLRTGYAFSTAAYVPLVLLHASVAVRIAADVLGAYAWRELALHGNIAALSVFVILTIRAVRRAQAR